MPKFRCLCGESINLSPIPNKQGFKLIWEPTIEKFMDELVAAYKEATSAQEFEKQAYKLFYQSQPEFPQVYECPNCGRLAVLSRASNRQITFWYQRERTSGEADSLRSLVDAPTTKLHGG